MQICRVIGSTVATIKDEKLTGRKLLIVREADETGNPLGKPYVAVDTGDAGTGDLVLVAAGSPRPPPPRPPPPPDRAHQRQPGRRGHHGRDRLAGGRGTSHVPQGMMAGHQ